MNERMESTREEQPEGSLEQADCCFCRRLWSSSLVRGLGGRLEIALESRQHMLVMNELVGRICRSHSRDWSLGLELDSRTLEDPPFGRYDRSGLERV